MLLLSLMFNHGVVQTQEVNLDTNVQTEVLMLEDECPDVSEPDADNSGMMPDPRIAQCVCTFEAFCGAVPPEEPC